jgi:phage-related minor tail protein
MTGEASEEYTSIVEQMTDEVGALDDAFGKVEETAGFKFERAMETARAALLPVGETMLEIGASMLDGLMPVIETLAPVLEEMFSHLEQPLMDLVGLLPGLLEAFMPLLPVIGELAGMIAELAVAFMPVFVALLEALTPLLEPIMAVLQTVVDIFVAFAPVLVTLAELLGEMIEAILPIFLELWEQLEEPIMRVIEALIPIIEEWLPILATIIEQVILPLLELMAETLGVVLVVAIETLAGWLEWLAEKMDGVGYDFALAFQDMKIAVIEIINDLIVGFESLLNRGVEMVNGFIRAYNRIAEEVGLTELDLIGRVSFETLDVPGRFDFMRFREVDVSGVSDGRQQALLSGRQQDFNVAGAGDLDPRGRSGLPNGFRSIGIPALAEGGLIKGPMIGLIGEAGPEAVIPLDKLDKGGNQFNITVNAGMGTNGRQVGEDIVAAIKRYERTSGPVFASA